MRATSFAHVVHCDWSSRAEGRWMAQARRGGAGTWIADAPEPVPEPAVLLGLLFGLAADGPTLAAFDFPIGLPATFGRATGLARFEDALAIFGQGEWADFYRVAETPAEIGLRRPFYPRVPGGKAQSHLVEALGVESLAVLKRACERGGPGLVPAECMFWTMGAKQVGKAMTHGWQTVVAPARARGGRIWPFDGDLAALSAEGLTIAESYPGDAYRQIGLSMKGLSKRSRPDRAGLSAQILGWCDGHHVARTPRLAAVIRDGFDRDAGADDGFDAVIGLLAALAVVDGHYPDGAPERSDIRSLEGWILGRTVPA